MKQDKVVFRKVVEREIDVHELIPIIGFVIPIIYAFMVLVPLILVKDLETIPYYIYTQLLWKLAIPYILIGITLLIGWYLIKKEYYVKVE